MGWRRYLFWCTRLKRTSARLKLEVIEGWFSQNRRVYGLYRFLTPFKMAVL
jgi:hypothetical protein